MAQLNPDTAKINAALEKALAKVTELTRELLIIKAQLTSTAQGLGKTPEPKIGIRNDGFFSTRDVMELVSLSRTSLWELRKNGRFPQPVRLSRNRVGFKACEIKEWIEHRESGTTGQWPL